MIKLPYLLNTNIQAGLSVRILPNVKLLKFPKN